MMEPLPAAKIGRILAAELERRGLRRPKEDDVTNPFEDENASYHVLVNDEGQHSLAELQGSPEGWTIVLRLDSRAACLAYINEHWTDMRPKSLVQRMEQQEEPRPNKRFRRARPTLAVRHQDQALTRWD